MPSTTPDLSTVTAGRSSGRPGGAAGRSAAAPAFGSDGAGRLLRRCGGTSTDLGASLGLPRSPLGQASSKLAAGASPAFAGGTAGGCVRALPIAGSEAAAAGWRSLRTVEVNRRFRFGLWGGGGAAPAGAGSGDTKGAAEGST